MDTVEIQEYLTSSHKGRGTSGYILLTNNLFFHIKDARIIDGALVIDNLYGTEKK